MKLDFVKLQGLGNDFVVVDRRREGVALPAADAVQLCDRHFGVGADGVLSVLPSEQAPLAMHVTNADGSVAEMCGNGLRCVVRWAVDRGVLSPQGGAVETGRGVLECVVEPDGQVRVDMGAPRPGPMDERIEVAGEALEVALVSMGNPHAIAFVDGDLRALATTLGPLVETHPRFPNRTNAEFARVVSAGEIDLVVWERGSGLTLACGTGACATAVVAVLTSRAKAGEPLSVNLPGGRLRIVVAPDLSRVWMTGPAVEVFEGSITVR